LHNDLLLFARVLSEQDEMVLIAQMKVLAQVSQGDRETLPGHQNPFFLNTKS
jgi:hypothetical protein